MDSIAGISYYLANGRFYELHCLLTITFHQVSILHSAQSVHRCSTAAVQKIHFLSAEL